MLKKINDISSTRTRTMFMLVGSILAIGVIVAIFGSILKSNTKQEVISSTKGINSSIQSIPGAKTTEQYKKLQEKANESWSQEASKQGSSFIPTLIANDNKDTPCAVNQELNKLLITNPEMVKVLTANPDIAKSLNNQETAKLFINPEFTKLLGNPEVVKLLSSPEFTKLLSNPDIVSLLRTNPDLINALAGSPETLDILRNHPEILKMLSQSPELLNALQNNPDILKILTNSPELVKALQNSPDILRMLANSPELLKSLRDNPELLKVANDNIDLVRMLKDDPELAKLITRPEFSKLLENSELKKLLQDPDFQQLLRDPAFRKLLADPKFLKMLSDPNILKLLKDPKLLKLLQDPRLAGLSENRKIEKMKSLLYDPQGSYSDLSNNKELTRILDDPEMAKILTDPKLLELLKNTNLLKALSNPLVLQALNDPDIQKLLQDPKIIDFLMANKDLVNDPKIQKLLQDPDLLKLLADNPEILDILAANPKLVKNLVNDPALLKLLAENPDLLKSLAGKPELLKSLLANPNIVKTLSNDPQILNKLANNPKLSQSPNDNLVSNQSSLNLPNFSDNQMNVLNQDPAMKAFLEEQRQQQLKAQQEAYLRAQREDEERLQEQYSQQQAAREQAINTLASAMEQQLSEAKQAWNVNTSITSTGSYKPETTSKTGSTTSTTAVAVDLPVGLKAGSILFAVIETSVNSDEPGPILAKIVHGRFKGAKLIGQFQVSGPEAEKLNINFNKISMPDMDKTNTISAVAIDPDTARTALASNVDQHYLQRFGTLFASTFLSGYASAVAEQGTSTSTTGTTGTTTTTTTPKLTGKEQLFAGLSALTTKMGELFGAKVGRKPTITINSGTSVGVLLLDDFLIGEVAKRGVPEQSTGFMMNDDITTANSFGNKSGLQNNGQEIGDLGAVTFGKTNIIDKNPNNAQREVTK